MGYVRVLIAGKRQSRSEGYLSIRDFDRIVHPVFEKYGIPGKVVVKIINGRIYEGEIEPDKALEMRDELRRAVKRWGLKSNDIAGWNYYDSKPANKSDMLFGTRVTPKK